MARKTHASTEAKNRWNEKTYRRYQTFFRYDTDKDLIDWIEAHKKELGTSNIFREAMEKYIAEYDSACMPEALPQDKYLSRLKKSMDLNAAKDSSLMLQIKSCRK